MTETPPRSLFFSRERRRQNAVCVDACRLCEPSPSTSDAQTPESEIDGCKNRDTPPVPTSVATTTNSRCIVYNQNRSASSLARRWEAGSFRVQGAAVAIVLVAAVVAKIAASSGAYVRVGLSRGVVSAAAHSATAAHRVWLAANVLRLRLVDGNSDGLDLRLIDMS